MKRSQRRAQTESSWGRKWRGDGHQNWAPEQFCPKPRQLGQTDGGEGVCVEKSMSLGPFQEQGKRCQPKEGRDLFGVRETGSGRTAWDRTPGNRRSWESGTMGEPLQANSLPNTSFPVFSIAIFSTLCKANHMTAVNHLWSAYDVLSTAYRNLLALSHLVHTSILWGGHFYCLLLVMREWKLRGEPKIM